MLCVNFIFSLFLIIFLSTTYAQAKSKSVKCPDKILKECKKYKNHRQLLSIAKKESGFKIDAKNGPYLGLMQINEPLWYQVLKNENIIKSKKEFRSLEGNIRAAYYILKYYNYDYDKYRGKKKHGRKHYKSKVKSKKR